MKFPPKYDVSEAITPPPCSLLVPPAGGSASAPSRVGSCDVQRPSNRSMSVCASVTFQSRRNRPTVLSLVRSLAQATGAPITVPGLPSDRTNDNTVGLLRSEEHTSELQSRPHL